MSTLRIGICLLFFSSAGVIARAAELALTSYPLFKWICFSGLSGSLACFAAIYVRAEVHRVRRILSPQPDMIKSPLWKSSSMA